MVLDLWFRSTLRVRLDVDTRLRYSKSKVHPGRHRGTTRGSRRDRREYVPLELRKGPYVLKVFALQGPFALTKPVGLGGRTVFIEREKVSGKSELLEGEEERSGGKGREGVEEERKGKEEIEGGKENSGEVRNSTRDDIGSWFAQ